MGAIVAKPGVGHACPIRVFDTFAFDRHYRNHLYQKSLDYLDACEVRFLKVGYLKMLRDTGKTIPRFQDLPEGSYVVGRAGLSPNLPKQGSRHNHYSVSHPWFAREHPDPEGTQLRRLVHSLENLLAQHDEVVFYDYASLPQHDGFHPDIRRLYQEIRAGTKKWDDFPKPGTHPGVRTVEEEAKFQLAQQGMHNLFTFCTFGVICIPEIDEFTRDEFLQNTTSYMSRGWCYMEFCTALLFDNICNGFTPAVSKVLHDLEESTIPDPDDLSEKLKFRKAPDLHFLKDFGGKLFTQAGDKEKVLKLFHNVLEEKRVSDERDPTEDHPHAKAVRKERLSAELEAHTRPYKPRPPSPKVGEYNKKVVHYASTWELTSTLRVEICKTQQIFSDTNSSAGPRLTARNLQRCPLSLVKHVFIELSEQTGFGRGVFTTDELNSCGLSAERTSNFFHKLCTLVAHATDWHSLGLDTPSVSDISKDPVMKNRLLQRMHLAAMDRQCRDRWETAVAEAQALGGP